jgi:hypothetical protein
MSGDRVYATVKSDEVFVFRYNYSEKKWENFTNSANASAITFRKRGFNFFIRIVAGGLRVGLDPISVLCASRLSVSAGGAGGAPVICNCSRGGFW